MQTFLPYADIVKSAKCLDVKRLGKQRVEAFQLLNVLLERTQSKGWRNHPALKMWIGYSNGLKHYYNVILQEWIDRGYKNTMQFEVIEGTIILPSWFDNEDFHRAHRSNLLRKDWDHYSKFFVEETTLPYIWPA
jgi:hypothetical protein